MSLLRVLLGVLFLALLLALPISEHSSKPGDSAFADSAIPESGGINP
jgi:hypothetical protein